MKYIDDEDINKIIQNIALVAVRIYKKFQQGIKEDSASIVDTNSSGDNVKSLDLYSSYEFINALSATNVHSLVGEESEKSIFINQRGQYRVAFDPLDGSSNIGNNSTVGSIFTIFKNDSPAGFLRKGEDQVVAGYVLYGPALEMVLAINNKPPQSFVFKNGSFALLQDNLICPSKSSIYSINYCNRNLWSSKINNINSALIDNGLTLRYSGSLVADAHRILKHGGIFAYHGDSKNPNGKLRLLYECFPMAKIFENAGGMAINDNGERILNLIPSLIHEKSSIIFGSKEMVNKFIQ